MHGHLYREDEDEEHLAWNYCGMFYSFNLNTTYGDHLRWRGDSALYDK